MGILLDGSVSFRVETGHNYLAHGGASRTLETLGAQKIAPHACTGKRLLQCQLADLGVQSRRVRITAGDAAGVTKNLNGTPRQLSAPICAQPRANVTATIFLIQQLNRSKEDDRRAAQGFQQCADDMPFPEPSAQLCHRQEYGQMMPDHPPMWLGRQIGCSKTNASTKSGNHHRMNRIQAATMAKIAAIISQMRIETSHRPPLRNNRSPLASRKASAMNGKRLTGSNIQSLLANQRC
jgi:hypothetical protein